jgi:hypothetical protein
MRATIFLKNDYGTRPYRTCYFSKDEYVRLLEDFTQYQSNGSPENGSYSEEIGLEGEHKIFIEFRAVAFIKTKESQQQ